MVIKYNSLLNYIGPAINSSFEINILNLLNNIINANIFKVVPFYNNTNYFIFIKKGSKVGEIRILILKEVIILVNINDIKFLRPIIEVRIIIK